MIPHAKLLLPLDASRGTWDRADLWELGEWGVLAFVADAPEKASQHTGKWIQSWLRERASELADTVADLSLEELRVVVSDLLTGIGDHLAEQGHGSAYAACSLALYCKEGLCVASVGDCAVYVVPASGPVRRLSDVTRAGGRVLLNEPIPSRVTSYAEGVYVGAEPRLFRQSEVLLLPSPGPALVALVSDGAEAQLGVDGLTQRLKQTFDPRALADALRQELGSTALVDDVTVLAFWVEGVTGPAGVEELRSDVEQKMGGLVGVLGEIRQGLHSLEAAQRSAAGSLIELKQGVKSLRERPGSAVALAAPVEVAPGRALQPELVRINDRLERLERGLGALLEHHAEMRAARPSGTGGMSYVWAGIALVIFLQIGSLLTELLRAGPTAQDTSEPTLAAEASTPVAAPRYVRRTCVELAYTPPFLVAAGPDVAQKVSTEQELEALLAQPKVPERPFVVELSAARKHWAALQRWRVHQIQVQRDESWTRLGERFVASPARLLALNPKVHRNGKDIDNPGEKLATRDIVRVPAFHYRLILPDRGPSAEELLQRLGIDPTWQQVQDRWMRRWADGRTVLLAPVPEGEALPPDESAVSGEFEVTAP